MLVAQVHDQCALVEGLVPRLLPQESEPFVGQPLPTCPRPVPYSLKIAFIAEVLRDRNRVVEVEHAVPPAAGHEDRLPRILNALHHVWQLAIWMTLRFLQPRQDEVKVVDGLVVFAFVHQMLSSNKLFGYSGSRWKHDPSLMTLNGGVPRRGS